MKYRTIIKNIGTLKGEKQKYEMGHPTMSKPELHGNRYEYGKFSRPPNKNIYGWIRQL